MINNSFKWGTSLANKFMRVHIHHMIIGRGKKVVFLSNENEYLIFILLLFNILVVHILIQIVITSYS